MSKAVQLVRARLLSVSAVTAIVGNRIYSGLAPQNAPTPYVQIYTISGAQDRSLNGSIGRRVNRLQIECWGATRGQTVPGIQAIFAALSDYSGGDIRGIAFDGERDDYDDASGRYVNQNDFMVAIAE